MRSIHTGSLEDFKRDMVDWDWTTETQTTRRLLALGAELGKLDHVRFMVESGADPNSSSTIKRALQFHRWDVATYLWTDTVVGITIFDDDDPSYVT